MWTNKGNALAKLGKDEETIVCYTQAIRLNPEDFSAWSNKGFVLNKLERHEEAIACYNQVIRFNSKDFNAWFNRVIH